MEMGGSTSITTDSGSSSSPPNSSTDSPLNSLKFGRKIYFEDVGLGALPKPGSGSAGSSSSGAATPPKKPRGGGSGGAHGQPPRCQVEGCNVDLSDVKAYYSRHKVCAKHSKTPTVVVAGIQQRFCQQCSRFHQLPEFDQGKRSCRRRLAGHNERRRKPQAGSMLSTRFSRLSSSVYENNNRSGSFLMDFSAYSRTGRDAWATARTSEREPGTQAVTVTGKFLQLPWHNNSENTRSDLYMQGSAGGSSYPIPGIPPVECITGGVTDSNCALSLLSNQPLDSRNPGVGTNAFINTQGASMAQPIANVGTVDQFSTTSWGFKLNEAGSSSHEMLPDLGLGQISQPLNSHYSGELGLSQQSRRQQNMELGHSRGYSRGYDSSTQQMHWSL